MTGMRVFLATLLTQPKLGDSLHIHRKENGYTNCDYYLVKK